MTDPEVPETAPPTSANGLLRLSRRQETDTVILDVAGDLDSFTAPRFQTAAEQALADRPAALVLDLSAVEFMASAGLTVLVDLDRQAAPHTAVRVVAANRAILRPLQIMGLDEKLTIFASIEDALAAS